MQTILIVAQVFLSLGLIGLVLIQHGKGADAGAAFGSGASATVFGAQGSGSFLTRLTAIMATLFFLTSMGLAYFAARGSEPAGLMDRVGETAIIPAATEPQPTAPVAPTDVPALPAPVASQPELGSDVPPAPPSAEAQHEAPAVDAGASESAVPSQASEPEKAPASADKDTD